ncbi:MAG: hypothetical protein HYS12_07080 [Planctomycetes bacterium]|nr:hypothetical protein [Planctomycetota bacterium]
MTPMLLSLTLALAPAPADEKITLPSGPPPQFGLAVIKDGKCKVHFPELVPYTTEETRTRVVIVDGKQVPVQEKVAVTAYRLEYRTREVDKPRAFDARGKEIDAKRLADLLKKETTVLLSADGKPVDPFYLRTMKDGTLTLAMPIAVRPAPVPPAREIPKPRDLPKGRNVKE